MFVASIAGVERLYLPLTNNRYQVKLSDLSVTDNDFVLENQRNEHGQLCVMLDWYDGQRLYPLSLVVAHAFKPTNVPQKYWSRLSVEFFDNNPDNLDPANLVWRYPKALGLEDYNGFAFIPMYTRYMINREGAVFDLKRQRFMKAGYSQGYFKYTLIDDVGNKVRVSRHRMLGFTFLDYPTNVDVLYINHINGVKGDDCIENLEWVTCEENIQHAIDTGLIQTSKPILVENLANGTAEVIKNIRQCCERFGLKQHELNKRLKKDPWCYERWPFKFSYQYESHRANERSNFSPVLVRNMRDGSVKEYSGVSSCAKALGFKYHVLQSRLLSEYDRVYPDGLQMRRKKDVTSWYEPENVEKAIAESGYLTACELRDCQTGVITTYDSQRELHKVLRICEAALHIWLSYDGKRVFKTFDGRLVQVRRCSVLEPWYIPEDQQHDYDLTGTAKRIIVRDIRDGSEKVYGSGRECAKAHGILTTTLNYRMGSKGQKLFDGRYLFKFTTEPLAFKEIKYVPSKRELRSKLP